MSKVEKLKENDNEKKEDISSQETFSRLDRILKREKTVKEFWHSNSG
jgi:hypothetical protein